MKSESQRIIDEARALLRQIDADTAAQTATLRALGFAGGIEDLVRNLPISPVQRQAIKKAHEAEVTKAAPVSATRESSASINASLSALSLMVARRSRI